MDKQEVIEIVKNEAKLKGWNFEPNLATVFKPKKKILYWKDEWQISFINSSRQEGKITIFTYIELFIDDASGKIFRTKIKRERFKQNTKAIMPSLVPVLSIFEKTLFVLLAPIFVLVFPIYFLIFIVYWVISLPIYWVKEYLKPKAYCPVCKGHLRTINAKQCCHCFFAWHETN